MKDIKKQLDKKNPEHRAIVLKLITEHRSGLLKWSVVMDALEQVHGFQRPHRNSLGTDEEFKKAFQKRKQLLSSALSGLRPTECKNCNQAAIDLAKYQAYYTIAVQMLANRGVTEAEVKETIKDALSGQSWA